MENKKTRKLIENIQESLISSELQYRRLFEAARDGILILDAETGIILEVNPFLIELLGYSKEQFMQKKVWEIGTFKNIIENKEKFLTLNDKGYIRYNNLPLKTAAGKTVEVEFVSNVYLVNNVKVIQWNIRDITQQRQFQKQKDEEAKLFLSLFNHMSSGAAIYKVINDGSKGEDYIIQDFNLEALRLEGKTRDEVIGKSLLEIRPTIDQYGLISVFKKVWETGESAHFPAKIYTDERFNNWYENRVFKLPSGEIVAVFDDVTEKTLLKEKIEQSEEKYRRLYETMDQGVIYQAADGNILSANPSAERILGLTTDEITGRTSMNPEWRTIHEDGSPMAGSEHPTMIALRTGKPAGPKIFGIYNPQKNEHVWISAKAIPLFRKKEKNPYQVYVVFQDITAEYVAKINYMLLFNQMVSAFAVHEIICDDQGKPIDYRFLVINPAFEKMTALKAEDILNKTVLEVMPDIEPEWIERYGKVALTGEPTFFELYSVNLEKYFAVTAYQTAPGRFACTFTDVTQRIKAEKEAKEITEKLKALFINTPVLISIFNEEGRYIDVSESMGELLNLPLDEIRGKTFSELLPAETAKDFMNAIEEIINTGKPVANDLTLEIKGLSRIFKCEKFPISPMNESLRFFGCVSIEITEQIKAENLLKKSEKKYRSYIKNAPVGVIIVNEKGKILEVNPAVCAMTGYNKNELLHMTISDFFFAEDLEDGLNHFQQVTKHGFATAVLRHRTKSGLKKWWTIDAVKLTNDRFMGYAIDMTEIKEAEEKLAYLSYHDQLTGLYNRRFFEEELLRLDNESNLPLTIIMADVNGLKLINDSFGHEIGDLVLKNVAEVMQSKCRPNDVLARLGGDEFIMILPKTEVEHAKKLIRMFQSLLTRKKVSGVRPSVSFGYEIKKQNEEDIQEVVSGAENYMYRHKIFESESMHSKTIDIVMNTLFEKSSREMGHSQRVSEICEKIAAASGLDNNKIGQVKIAGLVHDIGKIGINENILNKIGALNANEWKEMRKHSESGWRILASSNEFSKLAEFVREHHERWDGNGYPRGLKENEISLEARIIALADAYDAMTSLRSYSKGLSKKEAIEELERCSGTQFDPTLTKIFIEKVLDNKVDK